MFFRQENRRDSFLPYEYALSTVAPVAPVLLSKTMRIFPDRRTVETVGFLPYEYALSTVAPVLLSKNNAYLPDSRTVETVGFLPYEYALSTVAPVLLSKTVCIFRTGEQEKQEGVALARAS